jgi:hypothetical protein
VHGPRPLKAAPETIRLANRSKLDGRGENLSPNTRGGEGCSYAESRNIRHTQGLLMSLFFVAVGMSIDLEELATRPLEFVGHTAVLIGIKISVLLPLALAFGYTSQ